MNTDLTSRIYLDWNATTPLYPSAKDAMIAAFSFFGNPSSIHKEGRAARMLIEKAREDVASLVGANSDNVIFTSGTTEAANALFMCGIIKEKILYPGILANNNSSILVSQLEHPAIINAAGSGAILLPVDSNGIVRENILASELENRSSSIVSIQLTNNETGILQPISNISEIIKNNKSILICDATQAIGKIYCNINEIGADIIIISAHKFGGPKGVGAIIFKDNSIRLASTFIKGGGQERGQRGGTENLLGIVGMGEAASQVKQNIIIAEKHFANLQQFFESKLKEKLPTYCIIGENSPRIPNTTCISFPNISAERIIISLDLAGIAVSSGSACSSGKVKKSSVLQAMGLSDAISEGAIRISTGIDTKETDLTSCIEALEKICLK